MAPSTLTTCNLEGTGVCLFLHIHSRLEAEWLRPSHSEDKGCTLTVVVSSFRNLFLFGCLKENLPCGQAGLDLTSGLLPWFLESWDCCGASPRTALHSAVLRFWKLGLSVPWPKCRFSDCGVTCRPADRMKWLCSSFCLLHLILLGLHRDTLCENSVTIHARRWLWTVGPPGFF